MDIRPQTRAAWVAESLHITLRSALRLATWPPRSSAAPAASLLSPPADLLSDLIDHAQIWSELRARGAPSHPAAPDHALEIASYVGRVAAGLESRMLSVPAEVGAEVCRAAVACLPDLEAHRLWADTTLRWGEARGSATLILELRGQLPSRREFAASCH